MKKIQVLLALVALLLCNSATFSYAADSSYVDRVRKAHAKQRSFRILDSTKRNPVRFDTHFESGSLGQATCLYADSSKLGAHYIYSIVSRSDPKNPFDSTYITSGRWFYFRMAGVRQQTVHLLFDNTDPTFPVYSYDGVHFDRFEPQTPLTFDRDTVYVAYCMPYTNDRLAQKSAQWIKNPRVESMQVIGFSAQNRPLFLYTITDRSVAESEKRQVYIHARIHPSETTSSFVLEGLMEALLGSDKRSEELLKKVSFHIIPVANPDGVAGGFSRSNALGVNLEGNFVNATSPTQLETQAIFGVVDRLDTAQPLDLVLNLHAQVAPKMMFWLHTAASTSQAYYDKELSFFNTVTRGNPLFNPADSVFSKLHPRSIERYMWQRGGGRTLSLTFEDTYTHYNTDPKTWVSVENSAQTGERLLWSVGEFLLQPAGVERFIKAYPGMVVGYTDDSLLLADGQKVLFDDGKGPKTHLQRLDSATPSDHFAVPYPKGPLAAIGKDHDPGRYRSDALMRAMYGHTKKEVEQHLITINWCPKLFKNKKVRVTTKNNVHLAIERISAELELHPEWEKYLATVGSYFWRPILNTNRLSAHSFGIAVDIEGEHSHYWLWDQPKATETTDLPYHNAIPEGIVEIFEKHGFVWGGKWYHYDTMHFEYRPELL